MPTAIHDPLHQCKNRNSPSSYTAYTPSLQGPQLLPIVTEQTKVPDQKQHIRQVVGSLLHYTRANDPRFIEAIRRISETQSDPTEETLEQVNHVIGFAHTIGETSILYTGTDTMKLTMQSDASYASRPGGKSIMGGWSYLLNSTDDPKTTINGFVQCHSKVMDTIVQSAQTAEQVALNYLGQKGMWERTILNALKYPQRDPTNILTDSNISKQAAHREITIRKSKAVEQRWQWYRQRCDENIFNTVYISNTSRIFIADLFTKPQPVWKLIIYAKQLVSDANYTRITESINNDHDDTTQHHKTSHRKVSFK